MRSLSVVCGAVVAVLLCAATALSATGREVISLKFATLFPATTRWPILKSEWCKEVEKGQRQVKVEFLPRRHPYPSRSNLRRSRQEYHRYRETFASYTAGRFPLTEGDRSAFRLQERAPGHKVRKCFHKKFRPKEFDAVMCSVFHTRAADPLARSNQSIKLEDVKGMKIRSTGTSAPS